MKYTHISYTGAGVDWHESEAKAIERLGEAIADARSDAIRAGEWPCDCDEWFVAKITHRVDAEVTQQFDIAKAQHTRGDVLDLLRVLGGCAVTRTIDERIDAAIAGLLWKEQITSEEQVESILREHLVEQWLDAPDGPGWWWIKWYGLLSTTNIRQDQFECGYWVSGHKWQRAIEPS